MQNYFYCENEIKNLRETNAIVFKNKIESIISVQITLVSLPGPAGPPGPTVTDGTLFRCCLFGNVLDSCLGVILSSPVKVLV